MRVEQQGHDECMLATIAALSDTSLADVRDVACAKVNTSCWADPDVPYPWDVVHYLIRHYKAKGVSATPLRKDIVPGNVEQITLDGRGSIVIGAPIGRNTHIMPFEKGLLYDPRNPTKPFRLRTLKKRYPDWTIVRVTKARKKRV